jgi:hypothetical protein
MITDTPSYNQSDFTVDLDEEIRLANENYALFASVKDRLKRIDEETEQDLENERADEVPYDRLISVALDDYESKDYPPPSDK